MIILTVSGKKSINADAEVIISECKVKALGIEFLVKNKGKLENKLYTLPQEVDENIAKIKLESMGIEIDTLTKEQEEYLRSWNI